MPGGQRTDRIPKEEGRLSDDKRMVFLSRALTDSGLTVFCAVYSLLPLEMEVQTDRDHMTVVIELLILDVLILGFNLFQPNVPIGAVD